MDGNGIFQTLTAFILALFSGTFLFVYLYDNKQKFAGWLAIAYFFGLIAFFLDIDPILSSVYYAILTNSMFWGTSACFLAAVCARNAKPFPMHWFLPLLLCGYATTVGFSMGTPNLMWRSSTANIVAGLMIALALPIMYQNRHKKVDRAIFLVLAFVSFIYCIRPILAFTVFSSAEAYQSFDNSPYTLILQLTSALSALACAVVMLLAAGLDMTDRLYHASVTDHLTGLRNRRGLDDLLAELNDKNDRDGRAIIAIDIDKFKDVNDNYGHDVGDQILIRVGKTLRTLVDPIGEVARSGGEEFLIVLNGPCSPAAMHFSEQIRYTIAMVQHPELGHPGKLLPALEYLQSNHKKVAVQRCVAQILLYTQRKMLVETALLLLTNLVWKCEQVKRPRLP